MIKIAKIQIGHHKLSLADLLNEKRNKKQNITVVDVKKEMEQILEGGSTATLGEKTK